ncbi:hypothetical protein DPMN_095693 [Dreissena polymorpha]|uniref:N-acetyltransferase domain-containing protein n=1 Tax=Dreissena polymorpha TaxID=45954 RepID=A0A9D4R302_DREPO|nr:hypothetical protein DPMN_095693 [Dreissena polymorpha]
MEGQNEYEYLKPREELETIVNEINNSLDLPDGLHIEISSTERTGALVDFLADHFIPDEPLSKSLGLVMNEEGKQWHVQRFSENLSILLIDDVTSDVVGVRTICTCRKNDKIPFEDTPDNTQWKIFQFLYHKREEMDVFKRFDVNVAFKLAHVAVRADYRRLGLATKLIEAALMFCSRSGLKKPCVTSEGTSPFTRNIYDKNGFDVLHTFYFDDYLINGDVVFKNMGDNLYTKIYAKQLTEL